MLELVQRILRPDGHRPRARGPERGQPRDPRISTSRRDEGARGARLGAALHARRGPRRTIAWYRALFACTGWRRDEPRRSVPLVRRRPARCPCSLGETPLANSLLAEGELDEPEPTLPARARLLPQLHAGADHRDRAARAAVRRVPLLLVVLRHDARARRASSPSASSPSGTPRRRQPGRRGRQQRRLPAPVLHGAQASRCWASSPPRTSRASPRGARHPDDVASSSTRAAGRAPRRRAARRRAPRATTCSPTWPISNGFVERHRERALPTTASRSIEVPYVARHDRPLRVRHRSTTSTSATSRSRPSTHLVRAARARRYDVERLPIHGGSLRVFARHARESPAEGAPSRALLAEEEAWGIAERRPRTAPSPCRGRAR